MAVGRREPARLQYVRFENNSPDGADDSVISRLPKAKEWMPLPVREAYLERVATAATIETLDTLLREARQRYLGPSLGDVFAAVDRRRRELER